MLSFLMYILVLMSVEVLVKVSSGTFLFPVCKSHHAEELLFMNEKTAPRARFALTAAAALMDFRDRQTALFVRKSRTFAWRVLYFSGVM